MVKKIRKKTKPKVDQSNIDEARAALTAFPPEDSPMIAINECDLQTAERLQPFAFLINEYAPDKYHVWIALAPGENDLKVRILLLASLGRSLEDGDSYDMYMPGSKNFQADGFMVRIHHRNRGRFVTGKELQDAGFWYFDPTRKVPYRLFPFIDPDEDNPWVQ
jgi:hypothetical protein